MAIRRFNCPTIASRDILQVDLEACLNFFKDSNGSIRNSINGKLFELRCTTLSLRIFYQS